MSVRFLLVGLAASPLILALARHDVKMKTRAGRRLWQSSARLGPWSYSLYVFHLPIVVLGAALLRHERPTSSLVSVVMVYGFALVVMTFVYPLSVLTERHTPWVRARDAPALRRGPGTTSQAGAARPDCEKRGLANPYAAHHGAPGDRATPEARPSRQARDE